MSHSISVDRFRKIQPDYGYTAGADYLFDKDLKTQALELLEKFKHPRDSEEREETRVSTLKKMTSFEEFFFIRYQWPLSLTWFNFNPSMDK